MRLLDPYTPPMTLAGIDLDLSRNEGQPPDMSILDEVSGEPGLLNRYPDSSGLRDKVSKLRDVSPEATLVTAGGDDALLRCCAALLTAGTRTVTTTPTFEMIARYSALQGADLVEVPWKNGPFPTDRLVGSAEAGAVCLIVSPNNPTGEVIGSEDLLELAEAFEYVVLDGAYMEFAAVDLTRDALQQPNVLMLRTLSKAWRLAGLRVGYLLGEPSLVRRVSAFGNPYHVSRLSLAIAEKRLEAGDVDDAAVEGSGGADLPGEAPHYLRRRVEVHGKAVAHAAANRFESALVDFAALELGNFGIDFRQNSVNLLGVANGGNH